MKRSFNRKGIKMISVHFDSFEIGVYDNEEDAEFAILEASAEGVLIDLVHEGDCLEDKDIECTERQYSCIWKVQLQKEF